MALSSETKRKIDELKREYETLLESLHKRITYLNGQRIVRLSEYAKTNSVHSSALLNKAKRQTIPAFREKGIWKIGVSYK